MNTNPFSRRRSHRARGHRPALVLALAATVSLSACGGGDGDGDQAGEIGYWAPDGDLVFYYDGNARYFNGIVRIGEFDDELDALERRSDDFSVTIERAE